jgi:hypothetical protein
MRKGFGGKQPEMRDSKIESDAHLGKFIGEHTLEVGSAQSMVFSSTDPGPCWMSDGDKVLKRKDRQTGKTSKKFRNVADLQKDLREKGVSAKGTKDELQARCTNKDMPVDETIVEIDKGWEGKPKGMLQILWERGFVDPEKQKEGDCTVDGKKDAFGNVILETSLKHLMSLLVDFIEEETLLQCHGRLLGVKAERTPKCHPEIAGEGVEHDWGCSKNVYRRMPIAEKRTKKKFIESVRKAMDLDLVLAIERRRLFSKRAREHMLACSILDNDGEMGSSQEGADVEDEKKPHMTAHLIEKIVKQCKSHRSALDFDMGFVDRVVDKMRQQQISNDQQRS